jgi:hypothetical protein
MDGIRNQQLNGLQGRVKQIFVMLGIAVAFVPENKVRFVPTPMKA